MSVKQLKVIFCVEVICFALLCILMALAGYNAGWLLALVIVALIMLATFIKLYRKIKVRA